MTGTGLAGRIRARVDGVPSFSGARWDEYRVHADLPAALEWVLGQLDQSWRPTTAHLWQEERLHRRATLYQAGDKDLVVLADDVDVVASLLPRRGYRAKPLDSSTPLAALRPQLPARVYNMLSREGFTTVEQVAALSDTALMTIRKMGESSLTALRDAIAVAAPAKPVPARGVRLGAAQVRELVELLSTLSSYAEGRNNRDLARRADAFLLTLTGTAPTGAPSPRRSSDNQRGDVAAVDN